MNIMFNNFISNNLRRKRLSNCKSVSNFIVFEVLLNFDKMLADFGYNLIVRKN